LLFCKKVSNLTPRLHLGRQAPKNEINYSKPLIAKVCSTSFEQKSLFLVRKSLFDAIRTKVVLTTYLFLVQKSLLNAIRTKVVLIISCSKKFVDRHSNKSRYDFFLFEKVVAFGLDQTERLMRHERPML
jgi:hypothetical protein